MLSNAIHPATMHSRNVRNAFTHIQPTLYWKVHKSTQPYFTCYRSTYFYKQLSYQDIEQRYIRTFLLALCVSFSLSLSVAGCDRDLLWRFEHGIRMMLLHAFYVLLLGNAYFVVYIRVSRQCLRRLLLAPLIIYLYLRLGVYFKWYLLCLLCSLPLVFHVLCSPLGLPLLLLYSSFPLNRIFFAV